MSRNLLQKTHEDGDLTHMTLGRFRDRILANPYGEAINAVCLVEVISPIHI
jgi:hypothetical protein